MSSTLYNLDKPDEQADLKLKDADPLEIIEATYKLWASATKELYKEDFDYVRDVYVHEARKIFRPVKEKFTGELHTDDIPFIVKMPGPASLYLTTLLNETGLSKLVVGKHLPIGIHEFGNNLQPGKTIELLADKDIGSISHLGWVTKGGTVINRGNATRIGFNSSKGTFINLNKAGEMGAFAEGGVWVNCGVVYSDMGRNASGGIFINCGKIAGIEYNGEKIRESGSLGWCAQGGVFVTKTEPNHHNFNIKYVHRVGPKELEDDEPLSELMDQIEQASKATEIPKVEDIARKIDAHVKKGYKPRKIA